MTYELFNENSGICRFHRKWAEMITDEILMAHYGLEVDYKAHQFQLARAIHEREGFKSMPWESERVYDLILGFLEQWERHGLADPESARLAGALPGGQKRCGAGLLAGDSGGHPGGI